MTNEALTHYLPNTKAAPLNLGRVLILGLGVSGKAARSYCEKLLGGRISELAVLQGTADAGYTLEVQTGQSASQSSTLKYESLDEIAESFDLCIASPGISQFSALYEHAQSISHEIISEVEFAWRESAADSRWIAITGTNGKTTTTALCAHLLQGCGMRAAAVGNIGDACIEAVASGVLDVYVAEVSSYQLASTNTFAPDCAVLLNITPDHLSWHKSFEAYVAAKGKIFDNLRACTQQYAVLDATNEIVRGFVRTLRDEGRCAYVPVGTSEGLQGDMRAACGSANAAFVREDGMLVVALDGHEYELVHANELLIEGPHNVSNALMASAAALCMHAPVEDLRTGLRNFAPLEHRLEPCGDVAGVACYNDSKATNVDAVLVALHAFEAKHPLILLGGDDKGTDLAELAALAAQTCKAAICFGAAGPRFADAIAQTALPYSLVGTMEEALDVALAQAHAGDTILLSPACASFDEFDNFEHRGRVFKDLVAKRQGA